MAVERQVVERHEFEVRLMEGEQNPYLVYELCKLWRPESFAELTGRLPLEVSIALAQDGWMEYIGTRRGSGEF